MIPNDKYVAHIHEYTHFFTLKTQDPRVLQAFYCQVDRFTERVWAEQANRKPFFIGGNIFAGRVKDNSEFRMCLGQLDALLKEIEYRNVAPTLILRTKEDMYVPEKFEYRLPHGRNPYGYQIDAANFSRKSFVAPPHTSMIAMPVGSGKTVTLCYIATLEKTNFAVAVLPKYMKKWVIDLGTNLGIDPKDILEVSGADEIVKLVKAVKKGKPIPPTIVFSITTLRLFIEAYTVSPAQCSADYGCIPQELWGLLKIGLVGIDEAHEHLHEIYTLVTHLHGPKLVALSGTMLSEKTFESLIQKTLFPYSIRFLDIKMKKYIKAYQLMYTIGDVHFSKVKTMERGRSTYSQNAFEKSVYKHPQLLANYIKLIKDTVQTEYLDQYMPGDKLAIYASTNHMCSIITNALKKWLGHRMDVRRYVEKDPYENVLEPDIRVTSISKAGAAIDIPGLRVLITTVSVSSHKSVIQLLGRLRELKDRDVRMYYLLCNKIKKHMDYAKNIRDLLQERVASMKTMRVNGEL